MIGAAITVAKIATGEIEEIATYAGKEYDRKGGLKGGRARAVKLTPQRRKQIAKKAAKVRWAAKAKP